MSNTQFAFIDKTRVPDRSALQASISSLGFDMELDPTYTPFEDAGFSPCTLNGRPGFGFEIYYDDACEVTGADEAMQSMAGGRDHCIMMVWHGSMNDGACALIVGAALAKDFDARVSYEGEPASTVEELLASAREMLDQGREESPPLASTNVTQVQTSKPWWKFW